MNKSEIIDEIARRTGVKKVDVKLIVDALRDTAEHALVNGEDFEIEGICSLYTRVGSSRAGRNPATGEIIQIPAKAYLRVKPRKHIKDLINA